MPFKLISFLGAFFAAAVLCPAANIVYHVQGAIPQALRGEEDFVHFAFYSEPGGSTPDTVTIQNFQTDGANYHFDSSQGTVTGVFPASVALKEDPGNYSAYTQRVTFGTFMSFDVVLSGSKFEGAEPVSGYVEFVLNINRSVANSYNEILLDSSGFGAVEIYRDSSIDSGHLVTDSNAAFAVTLIPEPSTLALAALLPLGLRHRR